MGFVFKEVVPLSIPTMYKGVLMRSRFEADIAYFIDGLGYKWLYEPQSYLLDNGLHYWPDFYVQELKLFIECRGYFTEKGQKQINGFSQVIRMGEVGSDLKTRPQLLSSILIDGGPKYKEYPDYLIIGPERVSFVDSITRYGNTDTCPAYLVLCSVCGKYSFLSLETSYQCRYCGKRKTFKEWHELDFNDGRLLIKPLFSVSKTTLDFLESEL